MNNLSLKYIAGLFDGEGTFCICVTPHKGTHLGFVAAPVAQITVGHADDILYSLREMFGGLVCLKTKVPTWRVFRLDDCMKFAKTMYPYLKIRKEHCALFINILSKMNGGIQYTKEGILWIVKEAEKLTYHPGRRKWTYEKIVDAMSKNKPLRLRASRSKRAMPWTSEEKKFLKENWKHFSDKELSSKMNRSRYGIKSRRQILGLIGQSRIKGILWSKEETSILKDLYETFTDEQIAEKLNRTSEAVKIKRQRLKLHRKLIYCKKCRKFGNRHTHHKRDKHGRFT